MLLSDPAARLDKRTALILSGILLFAVVVRLTFFIGYQGHDDRTYISYAYLYATGGSIVQTGLHDTWISRPGGWLPMAWALQHLGAGEHALAWYSLACSIGAVLVTFYLGAILLDTTTALIAAALVTVFPLDVLYATRMFADPAVGLWCALAYAFFIHAWKRKAHSPVLFFLAGAALGFGWTTKETALLAVLPALVLLWRARAGALPGLLSALIGFSIVFGGELWFWKAATGDALFRLHASLALKKEVVDAVPMTVGPFLGFVPGPLPHEVFRSNNTVLDAILMYALNEEYGLLYYFVWPIALWVLLRRFERPRPLALFLTIVGSFLAFFPFHFPRFTLNRDPRYTTTLSSAAILLFVWWASRFKPRTRNLLIAAMALTWLPCIYLGYASSSMGVQRELVEFSRQHSEQTLWLSNRLAADVVVLSGFDRTLPIGVHWIEQGYKESFGPLLNAPLRCMRPETPAVIGGEEIKSGFVAIGAGNQAKLPAHWSQVQTVAPRATGLTRLVQSVLRGVHFPEKLISHLAPSQNETVALYRVN